MNKQRNSGDIRSALKYTLEVIASIIAERREECGAKMDDEGEE